MMNTANFFIRKFLQWKKGTKANGISQNVLPYKKTPKVDLNSTLKILLYSFTFVFMKEKVNYN